MSLQAQTTHLLLAHLPAALTEITEALPPSDAVVPARASAALQNTYGTSFDERLLLDALRVYYATAALFIGEFIAPECDLSAGSGAECLIQLWTAGKTMRLLRENCEKAVKELSAESKPCDIFRDFYQRLFPSALRHANGEFYTPGWLAKLVFDRVEYSGGKRLLDPACGSGIFLIHAAARIGNRHDALSMISGFDTNPLAVLAARVNLLHAAGTCAKRTARVPQVHLHDCVLDENTFGTFEAIAGNPPWVLWDNLATAYRIQREDLWRKYGLFNLTAREAQLGGGKKDLAMLMTYAAADKYLADGGRLAFIVNQSIVHSRSGSGFRRFMPGENLQLAAVSFDDLSATSPFDVPVRAGVLSIEKGSRTSYPVPYHVWMKTDGVLRAVSKFARPRGGIDGPWQILEPGTSEAQSSESEASCEYVARTGAYSGGANGVFWVEAVEERGERILIRNLHTRGKQQVEQVTAEIERELLYPLLCWRDVSRWRASPSLHILLVQDAQNRKPVPEMLMQGQFPLAHDYLKRFKAVLRGRKSSMIRQMMQRTAFYAMFGIGPYTLSAWKVIWRRMDREINAAVAGPHCCFGVEKPVIPQETLTFIPCGSETEAHYLCALLNSPQATEQIRSISAAGGKSFGTAGSIMHLALKKFDPSSEAHLALAEISETAHTSEASRSSVCRLISELIEKHTLLR